MTQQYAQGLRILAQQNTGRHSRGLRWKVQIVSIEKGTMHKYLFTTSTADSKSKNCVQSFDSLRSVPSANVPGSNSFRVRGCHDVSARRVHENAFCSSLQMPHNFTNLSRRTFASTPVLLNEIDSGNSEIILQTSADVQSDETVSQQSDAADTAILSTKRRDALARVLSPEYDNELDIVVETKYTRNDKMRESDSDRQQIEEYDSFVQSEKHFYKLPSAPRNKETIKAPIVEPSLRKEQRATTEFLLGTSLGEWSLEQWIDAADLLSAWPEKNSVRTIALRFALLDRVYEERAQSSFPQHSNDLDWLNLYLLDRLVHHWRQLTKSDQYDSLVRCGLSPKDVLHIVLDVYHKQYGADISEKILFFIVDVETENFRQSKTPKFADRVLDECIELSLSGVEYHKPSTKLLNTVLLAWRKQERKFESTTSLRRVLQRMRDLGITVDKVSYRYVFEGLASQRTPQSALEAENLLDTLIEDHKRGAYAQPDVYAFAAVAEAWSKSGHSAAAERAEHLYDKMMKLREEDCLFGNRRFDIKVVNEVLKCWLSSGKSEAGSRAESFFRSSRSEPNRETFSLLIATHAASSNSADMDRLLEESQNLEDRISHDSLYDKQAVVKMFSSFAKLRNPKERIRQAENLMHRVQESNKIALNIIILNSFLKILTSTDDKTYILRAEKVVDDLRRNYPDTQPNTVTYSTLMSAWARLGEHARVRRILEYIYSEYKKGNSFVKPDVQCFNILLSAIQKSTDNDAPEQALNLLQAMEKLSTDGDLDVQPDGYSLATTISCITKRRYDRKQSAMKAFDLLDQCRSKSKMDPSQPLPNTYCFNAVMNSFAGIANVTKTEEIFMQMIEDFEAGNRDAQPSTTTFNILLKAWAFSKRPDAVDRAEQIISQMQDLTSSQAMNVPPNSITYTTLITCNSLSERPGAPQRAEEIVKEMDQLYKESRIREGPSLKTFESLRTAWMKSNEKDKIRAIDTIDREIKHRFGAKLRS